MVLYVLWLHGFIVLWLCNCMVFWFSGLVGFEFLESCRFMFLLDIDPISMIFKFLLHGSSSFPGARLLQIWSNISKLLI